MGPAKSKLHFDNNWSQLCAEAAYDYASGYAPAQGTPKAFAMQMDSYGLPQGTMLNQEAWEGAMGIITSALEVECGGFRILSEEEAFEGTDDGSLEPLPLNTSAGFGLSKFGKSKAEVLDHPEGIKVVMDELHRDWETTLGDPKTGELSEPMRVYFAKESLKDEKRDWDRVRDEKTRVFTSNSFITTWNSRRIIGHFCALFMTAAAHGTIEPKPGFNMTKGRWHAFLEDMFWRFTAMLGIDADVRKFDKNYPMYMLYFVAVIIASLARGGQGISTKMHAKLVMRTFWKLASTPGVCQIFGCIFLKNKSMPSGYMATVIINSITLWLIYAYAFCCKMPQTKWKLKSFRKRIKCCFLGDDNGFVQNPRYDTFGSTVEECYGYIQLVFKELGPWELTLPREDGSFANVEQFSFAGYYSQFIEDVGMFVPRLPFERIMAIMEMYKKMPKTESPAVVTLARYDAGLEKCFPLLWSNDQKERDLCVMIWIARAQLLLAMRRSIISQEVAAANGSPSLGQIAMLYFGKIIDEAKIRQRIFETPLFHAMAHTVHLIGPAGKLVGLTSPQ